MTCLFAPSFTSLFFGLSYVRERRKMKMRFNKFRR
ncbi:TPA: small membrane protein, partial [Klebsiella pneumoniae]|nr:small membrane protein [Klebsiella pneumoniae]